jgi:hypothetical protein
MSAISTVRGKVESQVSPAVVLTGVGVANTLVLLGLDRAGMIPSWLKLAAGALLAF